VRTYLPTSRFSSEDTDALLQLLPKESHARARAILRWWGVIQPEALQIPHAQAIEQVHLQRVALYRLDRPRLRRFCGGGVPLRRPGVRLPGGRVAPPEKILPKVLSGAGRGSCGLPPRTPGVVRLPISSHPTATGGSADILLLSFAFVCSTKHPVCIISGSGQ
jgi:hypothetical protein